MRETFAAIRSYGNTLVPGTILWADEIRLPDDANGSSGKANAAEFGDGAPAHRCALQRLQAQAVSGRAPGKSLEELIEAKQLLSRTGTFLTARTRDSIALIVTPTPEDRTIAEENKNSSMIGVATIGAFVIALLGFLGISSIADLGGDTGPSDADTDADTAACGKAFAALEARNDEVSTGLAPAYWAYAQELESAALNTENDELRMYFERDAAASRGFGDAWGRSEGYLIDPAAITQRQIDQDSWVAMCTE